LKVETRKVLVDDLITLSPFILYVIILLSFEYLIQLPRTLQQQPLLDIEIDKLDPPVNAILLEKVNSHGTSQVSVREVYFVDWKGNEIFNYYFKGLIENGWVNIGRDEISYNDVSQAYCKQKYDLYLRYYEESSKWIYSITIYWGDLGQCDRTILTNWDYYLKIIIFLLTMVLMFILKIKQIRKYYRNYKQN